MIIFRYLIREILMTMGAITAILLLIIMGNQFIDYINEAADGQFPIHLVSTLMMYQLPSFLQLILPMAFFLGYLMAYGQLYLNYEMIVLQACGFSPLKLLSIALWPGLLTAIVVTLCTLWLTPLGLYNNTLSMNDQSTQMNFSLLTPGRFQSVGHDRSVYVEKSTDHGTNVRNIYIVQNDNNSRYTITRAESARQYTDNHQGNSYLQLSQGYQYTVTPGKGDADVTSFEHFTRLIHQAQPDESSSAGPEQLSTLELLRQHTASAWGELQYRFSLIIMVPILALMGISLSRINPRQGRFTKLLPALLLYIVYASLVIAAKDTVQSGILPAAIGVWPVHVLYLLLGIWMVKRIYLSKGHR